MESLTLFQRLAVFALPVLFAITLHEVAHGWVALRLGDPTARMMGRLSLNPLRHVDPVGTVVVPVFLFLVGGILFGWARPVPVTWENLRHPRRDMALVAAAGPLANLVMGLLWAGVMRLGLAMGEASAVALFLVYSGVAGVFINVVLMVLNLLPLPPLDGGRIVTGLLPPRAAAAYSRIEPWGILILVALLFTGVLGRIIWPPLISVEAALLAVTDVPFQLFNYVLHILFPNG